MKIKTVLDKIDKLDVEINVREDELKEKARGDCSVYKIMRDNDKQLRKLEQKARKLEKNAFGTARGEVSTVKELVRLVLRVMKKGEV